MKKVLTLIVAILIITGAWFGFHHHASAPTANNSTAVTTHPDPSNATFDIDDQTITLNHGTATTQSGGSFGEETDLTNTIAYGDLNNDGKEDAAFILIKQSSGTGTFLYVAGYVSGNVSYKSTNTVFLGDRIEPQTISIKNGIITVTYLDRGPNEPLSADPSILMTKSFSYSAFDNTIE